MISHLSHGSHQESHRASVSPPTLTEIAEIIAPIIQPMLLQYPDLSPALRRYFHDNIDWMIREMPVCATKASVLAIEEARTLGIPSLKNFWWKHQTKYDRKRQVLHWEHVVPVSDLRNSLLALPQPTVERVIGLLLTYEIAWITKAENSRLKRSKRANPHEEYRKADITLVFL